MSHGARRQARQKMSRPHRLVGLVVVWLSLALRAASLARAADDPASANFELFEKKIRPVLVEHCYTCHSAASEKLKGSLRLDFRGGVKEGGYAGPSSLAG